MKVLVLGATGKTGQLVVQEALAKGHAVTVLSRDPNKLQQRQKVRALGGNSTNAGDVKRAMEGQDAVIDVVGGATPYRSTTLETDTAQNTIAAMRTMGVKRLVVVTMMGLGESREQAPFWYRYLLMTTFLRGSSKDKGNVEKAVMASGMEFVIARPPILKDDPATGQVRLLEAGETGHAITRGDLARFLVEQLESDGNVGRAVTVVNT
jgi:uncharacterized protein YbjT (DUF2867 family)